MLKSVCSVSTKIFHETTLKHLLKNNAIVSVTIEIVLRHKNKNLGFGSICCCVDAGDFKCWLVDLRVTKSSNCEIGRERERARTRRERERSRHPPTRLLLRFTRTYQRTNSSNARDYFCQIGCCNKSKAMSYYQTFF